MTSYIYISCYQRCPAWQLFACHCLYVICVLSND